MTEPINPATDEQVAALKAGVGSRTWRNVEDVAASMIVDILLARIESDAAKLKALELERDTIQEYADQVGANLTAAEGTLAERDEQIARYEDLLIDIKLALSNTKTFYLPLAEAVADIIRRKKEADRGAI